jgi:hypothetical protein
MSSSINSYPRKCDINGISCGGEKWFDLKHIFETIDQKLNKTEKYFKSFHLNNTEVYELKENTFYEITFDEINKRKRFEFYVN